MPVFPLRGGDLERGFSSPIHQRRVVCLSCQIGDTDVARCPLRGTDGRGRSEGAGLRGGLPGSDSIDAPTQRLDT